MHCAPSSSIEYLAKATRWRRMDSREAVSCAAACSIGANVEEAQSGESRADFVHKLVIAQKEARECLVLASVCW